MEKWWESVIKNFNALLDNWIYLIGLLTILFIAFAIVVVKKEKKKTQFIARVGVMCALVVVLKQFTHSFGAIGRFELVHIPIIVAGFVFGPTTGIIVGFLGDFLGGLLAGYAPFPIIFPFGYAAVGLLAGMGKTIVGNSKIRLIICLGAIFVLTNYIVEFVTYAIYQTQVLGVDINVAIPKYFAARIFRILWQLPLFIFALAPIITGAKKANSNKK